MLDILDAIQSRVALKKSNEHAYVGLCPFHEEKTGSFTVCTDKQFYHCFGCGENGDADDFVKKFDGIPRAEWTPEEMQAKCDQMVLACRERGLNITCFPYRSEEDANVLNRFILSRVEDSSVDKQH